MASSNIKMLNKTSNNQMSDECYTPKEALEPLLKYLSKDKIYYDCTSGISSNIVEFLNQSGFTCKSSYGKDFLLDDFSDFDCIITNPPYSKKDKFIEKCYKIGKPFALLLPISSLQGQKRGSMFQQNGIELLVLNKRIDFTGKKAPHFGVAWFCNDILQEKIMFT